MLQYMNYVFKFYQGRVFLLAKEELGSFFKPYSCGAYVWAPQDNLGTLSSSLGSAFLVSVMIIFFE